MRRSQSKLIVAVAASLFIILLAVFSIYIQSPPDALPEDAAPTEFSAARAMKHVRAIAGKPRPVGSAEHKLTRDYLLAQLSDLGLNPTVQRATVVDHYRGNSYGAAVIQNIVARLKGSGEQALALAAHYDSAPTAPGANDDGAGVAVLLETLRALKAGAPLQNDVIILFTDGEEIGLLGAKAFVNECSQCKDVKLVLNFEARGNSGPVIMFETSAGNDWLIDEFAEAVRYPVANSLSYEIYRRMSNDTDLTVFKKNGMKGMNFAYIGGAEHYHTILDTADSVDQRSLQHLGSYALTLARRFGNLRLNEPGAGDAIYFNAFGPILFRYPRSWGMGLFVGAALLLIATVVTGFRKGKLTFSSLSFGGGFLLVKAAGSVAVVFLLRLLLKKLRPELNSNALGGGHHRLSMLSFIAIVITLICIADYLAMKKASMANLYFGGLLIWLLMAMLSLIYLPGASYLFTWPLLFGVVGAAVLLANKKEFPSIDYLIAGAVCPLPAIALFVPLGYLVFQAFGLNVFPAMTLMVTLLLSLLIPLIGMLIDLGGRRLLYCLGLIAIFLMLFSASMASRAGNTYSLDHVFYAIDANKEKAVWGTFDSHLDEWTSQFFQEGVGPGNLREFLPTMLDDILVGNAPLIHIPVPRVEVIKDERLADRRSTQLRVISPLQAPVITIDLESSGGLSNVSINGKRIAEGGLEQGQKMLRLFCHGFNEEDITLTVEATASSQLTIKVVDEYYGLPQIQGRVIRPRPDHIIAAPTIYSDSTLIGKTFTF